MGWERPNIFEKDVKNHTQLPKIAQNEPTTVKESSSGQNPTHNNNKHHQQLSQRSSYTRLFRLPYFVPHTQFTQPLHSYINCSRAAVSEWVQGFSLDLTLPTSLLNIIHKNSHFGSEVAEVFSRVSLTLHNLAAVLQLLATFHRMLGKFSLPHLLLTTHHQTLKSFAACYATCNQRKKHQRRLRTPCSAQYVSTIAILQTFHFVRSTNLASPLPLPIPHTTTIHPMTI